MSQTRTRRPPARRAPGSALPGVLPALVTPAGEPPEKEEVVIEPDLPLEEEDQKDPEVEQAEWDALDPEVQAEVLVYAELLAWEALSREEQAAAVYYAQVAAMPATETRWKAGTRAPRLKVGDYTLQPGEIVPGADGWLRRESYERLGRIERA